MLNIRSIHGLKAISLVASAHNFQPVTSTKLSQQLGLSVSYTESLLKELKQGGLIGSHRGPGGGYVLEQCMDDLSAWDVVRCFEPLDVESEAPVRSAEQQLCATVHEKLCDIRRHFLQSFPISQMVESLPKSNDMVAKDSLSRHFKPLPVKLAPKAPNSVFDLPNFMQLMAA